MTFTQQTDVHWPQGCTSAHTLTILRGSCGTAIGFADPPRDLFHLFRFLGMVRSSVEAAQQECSGAFLQVTSNFNFLDNCK